MSKFRSPEQKLTFSIQCAALSLVLRGKVLYPNNTAYGTFLKSSYWSVQEQEVNPSCVLKPATAQDLSTALELFLASNVLASKAGQGNVCKFAVRGGGHTAQAGSANIDDGITIDMSGINAVTLSSDKTSVLVGAGQRWGNVYAVLQPLGLSVVGGSGNQIGVGAVTHGG